ncbi:MAG: c-type cytochrome domain-containing protein, partial [Verrucomicrobiota bacterium]|nr:c-type cytochrome domain-containing protein [Verrucomicrobiota bacterium]
MVFLSKLLLVIPVLAVGMVLDQAQAATPEEVRFGVHVRPLLSHYCIQCHGPDEEQRKAKLRLDTREGLFGSSGDRRIVVPG